MCANGRCLSTITASNADLSCKAKQITNFSVLHLSMRTTLSANRTVDRRCGIMITVLFSISRCMASLQQCSLGPQLELAEILTKYAHKVVRKRSSVRSTPSYASKILEFASIALAMPIRCLCPAFGLQNNAQALFRIPNTHICLHVPETVFTDHCVKSLREIFNEP
jgi:hypothetical protein